MKCVAWSLERGFDESCRFFHYSKLSGICLLFASCSEPKLCPRATKPANGCAEEAYIVMARYRYGPI